MAILNGGFETGDLTNWSVETAATGDSATVTADAGYSGNYGCEVVVFDEVVLTHDAIDLTGKEQLVFNLHVDSVIGMSSGIGVVFSITQGSSEELLYDTTYTYGNDDWETISGSVVAFSGEWTPHIRIYKKSGGQ